jgi:phosphonopyruvate decarboxylase
MIERETVTQRLRAGGVTLATGVPCSFLSPVIDGVISDPLIRYVGATSEGESVGIAAGQWLAGGKPIVMCQNSGLGNMVNPLTSLAHPSAIPLLIFCTWRGHPELDDEPQHELMGRTMHRLLDAIEVEWAPFGATEAELDRALDQARDSMARNDRPFCLVVEKGMIAPGPLNEPQRDRGSWGELIREPMRGALPTRFEALERILSVVDDRTALVASTGKTGRELFTLDDRRQHFYQVGAMGCASAVGLGLALGSSRQIVVLDGDGAALMKLGNMATVGAEAPANLVHVILDNGRHDSTGGQRTVSDRTSFPEVAIACGYRRAVSCHSLSDLAWAMTTASESPGPHLVHVCIQPGSISNLGRPTLHPSEVARRFRAFLMETSGEAPSTVPAGVGMETPA